MMDAYWWALITMTTVSRKCPSPVIHFALISCIMIALRFFLPVKEKPCLNSAVSDGLPRLQKSRNGRGGETGKRRRRRQAPSIYFLAPGKSGGGGGRAPPPFFFGPLFLPLKADGSVGRFCAHISETIFRSWGGERGGRTIPFVTFCFSVVIFPPPLFLQRGISVRNGKGRKRIEGGGGKRETTVTNASFISPPPPPSLFCPPGPSPKVLAK